MVFQIKNKSKYKSFKRNFTFNWLLILMSLPPVNPRRFRHGNNFIYISKRSLKKIQSLPINEKIRQILIWKKAIQRNLATGKNELNKNLNYIVPTYSVDELILNKYPDFSSAFEEFLKSVPLLYLLSYQTDSFFKGNEISDKFLHFLPKFRFFFTNLSKVKNVVLSYNIFRLKLEIRGKNNIFMFPKIIHGNNIVGDKKMVKFIMSFKIQVAQHVIMKILSFQKYKFLCGNFYDLAKTVELWYSNPKRYYRIDKNPNPFFSFLKIHCSEEKKNRKKFGKFWNFSKNILSLNSKVKLMMEGVFWSNQLTNFFEETVSSFLKIIYCEKKNDKEIVFFFSKKIWRKTSLISNYLSFSFLTDSLNLGIILPVLPYSNTNRDMNVKMNNKKYQKKKPIFKSSENFRYFYSDLNEISVKQNFFCIIKNKTQINDVPFSIIFPKNFNYLCFLARGIKS